MSVKYNINPDWNLVFLSCYISLLIFLNYFFWSINSFQIIKFFNFFILLSFLFYFFFHRKFNNYNFLKFVIISLLILSLGSVTVDWDARSMWLFHSKRIFLITIYMLVSINICLSWRMDIHDYQLPCQQHWRKLLAIGMKYFPSLQIF